MLARKSGSALFFPFFVFFVTPVFGQTGGFVGPRGIYDRRGETVLTRPRPDYDALGIRVGVWSIQPSISSELGYDDNVQSSHTDRNGSFFVLNSASANADGTWSNARLNIQAGISDYRYFDLSEQNYTDWNVGASGRYDLRQDWSVFGGVEHETRHELQDDPSSPGSSEPIQYTLDRAFAGTRYGFNRLFFQPEVALRSYRYDTAVFDGVDQSQSYRDRDVYIGALTTGYALSPGRNLNLVGRVYRSNYINTQPLGFIPYDSTTYEIMTGIDYDSDGIWNYRLLFGVRFREYDDDRLKSTTNLALDGYVSYRPTAMTTITGTAFSVMEDGATPGDSGYNRVAGNIAIDHEYLRNVILHLSAGVDYVDYVSQDRSWTTLRETIGVTYLVNRNVQLSVGYTRTDRVAASRDTDAFNRDLAFVRIRLAL